MKFFSCGKCPRWFAYDSPGTMRAMVHEHLRSHGVSEESIKELYPDGVFDE